MSDLKNKIWFQGVENFGLDKIMDIWVLTQSEDTRKKGESLKFNNMLLKCHHCIAQNGVRFSILNLVLLRFTDNLKINDFFIRNFCKDKMGGFKGLKGYAIASEDRELEGKLAMVEKYNKRIPELVRRIYDCAQGSLQDSGESDQLKDLKAVFEKYTQFYRVVKISAYVS